MAVKKVIEIDVDVLNAQGGIDGLIKSFDEAEKSTKSLKQQMMEAQKEVTELSEKFGATSQEAINAAKRASELKDKIGDAKALTDAFNPDAKFNALSSSLGGVASGFAAYQGALSLAGVESKDLEQQLLRVQSAMALAQGLQGLGEARDSFKQLKAVAIDAFKGIKTAIGSTGIGLLVVALGAIYTYWDDIKEAVSGVSEQQKKLNADSQKNVDQQNEKLKSIGAQDNILKLQGKSEKEILAIKIKQTDEAILATEVNQKNQIQTNKLAVEGAKRNYEMLRSYIDFMQTPLRWLYKTGAEAINGIIDLLNKIPGVNIKGKLDETLGEKAADYLAKLGFDPDQVKADGEATIKESQDALLKLKNDRAGYRLAINDIDKKAAKDAELTEEEKQKKLKELNDKYRKDLAKQPVEEIDTTELQKLDATNQAKRDLILANNEQLINDQLEFELRIAQITYDSEEAQKERRKLAFDEKILNFQNTSNAIASIAKSGEDVLANLQDIGIAKGKAGQAVMKGLALVQIGVDSAIAFSKMMQGTESSAAGAASLAGPAAPATYLATKIAFYASGTSTILANIARAKKLLGSSGGPTISTASVGGASAPSSAPQFNVVGNAGINQIATTLGKEQPPIQTYVTAGNVTTQQALNRNIVNNASL